MRELLLEGRVSWHSEKSGRAGTLTVEPTRVPGLLRLVALLGFAAAAAVVVALVAAAVGASAASLGARWTAKRREQGLDDPITIVQQRARHAKEWLDSRRSPENDT